MGRFDRWLRRASTSVRALEIRQLLSTPSSHLPQPAPAPLALALEPRMMFDAAAAATAQ